MEIEKINIGNIEANKVWVDSIPTYYTLPAGLDENADLKLCIFLSGLSGNKEKMLVKYAPFINKRGYMAVFFDHYEHGERSKKGLTILNSNEEEIKELSKKTADRCFQNMYRYGWEIIGNGILDSQRVIDYYCEEFRIKELVMGGVSMGGDTTFATMGVDDRIKRALCLITTPDWLRPGMHSLSDDTIMDPGKPDHKSQWYYDQFNPITHLSNYKNVNEVLFVCGENDRHIPPENVVRFISNLERIDKEAAKRLNIWWNKGQGHKVPDDNDLEMLFDWFLLKKDIR